MRGIFAQIATAEQTEWTRSQNRNRINTKYYGLFRQLFKLAFSMDFWMVSAAGSKYSAEGRQLYKLSQAKAFAVNVQRVHATFSMLHLLARFSLLLILFLPRTRCVCVITCRARSLHKCQKQRSPAGRVESGVALQIVGSGYFSFFILYFFFFASFCFAFYTYGRLF